MSVASWTDAVLAVVSLGGGAWLLLRDSASGRTAGLGLLLVGIAALVGTLRFAGQEQLAGAHAGLSGLAACVGLPTVAAGWATAVFAPHRAELARRYVFGVLLVVAAMVWWVALVRTVLGALAMLTVAVAAARALPRWAGALGALGAALTLGVGLLIGTEGDLLGFPRVGWFHLGLAGANLALAAGLAGVVEPTAPAEVA